MHSTLQAELRFSQILKSTCRYCAQRQSSTTRSFHTAPRLRGPQKPSNNLGPVSGSGIGDNAKSHAARSEIAPEKVEDGKKKSQTRQPPSTSLGHPPAEDAEQERTQKFYGSSARRRLRNRMNRDDEAEYQVPEWFQDSNIHLYGEGVLSPGTTSKIRLVAADLTTGDVLERGPPPDSSGSPPVDPGPEENDESPAPKWKKDEEASAAAISQQGLEAAPKTYYVVDEQFEEAVRTARGLMQLSQKQNSVNGTSLLRDRLHLQYAGKDGDLLLDHIVEDLARHLGCDLMVLDAQDIADMISRTSDITSDIDDTAKGGRILSYAVLTNAYPDPSEINRTPYPHEEEEEDEDTMDDFEGSSPRSPPMNMPVMIGKPISIDLKGLFGPVGFGSRQFGDRPSQRDGPFADLFNAGKARNPQSGFAGVVHSLLKSLSERRNPPNTAQKDSFTDGVELQNFRDNSATQAGMPKDALIIHVKDLKAIQEIRVGSQFLQELDTQLARRQSRGEPILLIGTDSAREGQEPFTQERINESQRGDPFGTFQNIVFTPVLPNTTSKLALLHDRKQRIARANMRHLWEMTQHLKPSVFAHFKPGFWQCDFLHDVTPSDKACLESQIWSYQFVQRLAAYIAGAAPQEQDTQTTAERERHDSHLQPIISAATSHLNHSDKTKIRWAEKQSQETKIENPSRHIVSKDSRLSRIRASASRHEKRLMGGIIEARNINTTFNDVHMPVETIDALQTLTTLSLVRPDAFKYGVLASDKIPGLLLYGPPGTGKTLAAKAVAKESGATMLEVSAADINDMYVGEGEKNVKALFSLARKLSPCVVFLDEADAMFSARGPQGRRANHRELLNQFLREWDGMSNDSGSAFIMVATNRPMDLDDAVLRRLPRRLLVDLPTEPDRLEILKIHLRNEILAEDVALSALANRTPFYSGSDLKNVAVAAALNCVREEMDLAKQHQGDEPYRHPERRTLTAKHFDKALEEISASISEDMSSLKEIKKFDEQFGDKRGKKKKAPKLGFPMQEGEKGRDTVKVRD